MSLHDNQPDEIRSGPTDTTVPARHRVRRLVLTGVAGAVIVGGGGAYAFASGDGGPSTSPSSSSTDAPAAPGNGTDAPKPPADAPPATPPQAGPHIDGTVTAVSGSTVTVKDPDGFTRTIKTSGDTQYDDGVSSPLATGTKIHATGTVDSDGTSLDATQIGTMPEPGKDGPPAPPAGGGKAPAAPGQGSGSGSTDAPAAPSGAPSAPSGAPSAPSSSGSKSSGSTSSPSGSKSASPSASPTGS